MITEKPKNYRKRPPRKKEDDLDSQLLDLARVVRMTAAGRRLRFRAVVIIGDKKGSIGLGVAKGQDVSLAMEKARRIAKKNMVKIEMTEDSIPHEVEAKFGSARVLLKPQRKGRGLIAGGTVRIICTLVGIKNVSSKMLSKTKNKLNNARVTIKALEKLRLQQDDQKKVEVKTEIEELKVF
ncbi:MAG: 30S ribosomal protein S5 [Patescibacteria group bacterium]